MNRITPDDVGRRVCVRHVLPAPRPGAGFSDVVGILTQWRDGVLSVTRRDGTITQVAQSTVVAAKLVPQPPVRGRRTATAEHLQLLAARSWPAVDQAELNGWLLGASGGFTRRANCAVPGEAVAAGRAGTVPEETLRAICGWYRDRGLPVLAQVVRGGSVDTALAAAGWSAEAPTVVCTASTSALADRAGAPAASDGPRVDTVCGPRQPGTRWLAAYDGSAEGPVAAACTVLAGPPGTWFAAVSDPRRPSGTPVAVGRCAVLGRYAFVSAVRTHPRHRRRGLARAVTAALFARAEGDGARTVVLQVERDNTAARALYAAMGFVDHHEYHYRRGPGQ